MTKELHADLRLYIKTGDSALARNLCTQALYALERKDRLLQTALQALRMPCDRWNKTQSLIVSDVIEHLAKELTPDNAVVNGG